MLWESHKNECNNHFLLTFIFFAPNTILCSLCSFSRIIHRATLWGKNHLQFQDKEINAQNTRIRNSIKMFFISKEVIVTTKLLLFSWNWNLIVEVVYIFTNRVRNITRQTLFCEGGVNHAIIEISIKSIHLTLKLLGENKNDQFSLKSLFYRWSCQI